MILSHFFGVYKEDGILFIYSFFHHCTALNAIHPAGCDALHNMSTMSNMVLREASGKHQVA